MRRTLGLVFLTAFVGTIIGCFTKENKQPEPVVSGRPPGDKEHTLEYWGKVREVMRQKTGSNDMQVVATMVRQQAETVRRLPIDGVDYELCVAACAVAQYQEKMLKAAQAASYNPASLRTDPALKKTYMDACQQIATAMVDLKALHTRLTARYGVTFPPIEDQ
jgi:hypothetical protein